MREETAEVAMNRLSHAVMDYSRLLGKEPAKALQRHGANLRLYLAQELKRQKPSKADVSLEAYRSRMGKGKRRGSSGLTGKPSDFSVADALSGRLTGLKIRKSVVEDAKVKFGFASSLQARKKRVASGKKLRDTQTRQRRTVLRYGKELNITAWMVSREIAVRRSGIGYLGYGASISKFRKGDQPVSRKINHLDKYKRFAAKIEFLVTPNVTQFRLVDVVPGTLRVGEKRGLFVTASQRARADIKFYLVRAALANKRRAFTGRGAR